jgi:transposase-like protein
MARRALKELLEKRLEEEMAEYLGVARYEHAADRHTTETVTTYGIY